MLNLWFAGQVAGWNLALHTRDASTGELLFRLDAFQGTVVPVLEPRPEARQEGYYRSLVRCSKCPLHHLKNTRDLQKPKYVSQFRENGDATDGDVNGARARGGGAEQKPITCCAASALKRGPADLGERNANELPRSTLSLDQPLFCRLDMKFEDTTDSRLHLADVCMMVFGSEQGSIVSWEYRQAAGQQAAPQIQLHSHLEGHTGRINHLALLKL